MGLGAALDVRRRTGKGLTLQAWEIARLSFGPSVLSPRDYYARSVYDDTRYPGSAKAEVGGIRLALRLSRRLNRGTWIAVARDKLVFEAVARSLGLPVPRLVAAYHPGPRTHGDLHLLRTSTEIEDFLRRCNSYPLFGKPVDRGQGHGATSIDGYHPRRDRLRLAGGERIPVRDYVEASVVAHRNGYLFQERVAPDPELAALCGPRLTTLRLAVLNGEEGPRLFRATWRVPTGRNHVDNFENGKTGNLVGTVDPASGEVGRLVRGVPLGARAGHASAPTAFETSRHPDTGQVLVGTAIPNWNRAVSLVLGASSALPGLRWIGWDVALGRAGPDVLEVNRMPALPQVPGGPGAYDGEMRAFERRYGTR